MRRTIITIFATLSMLIPAPAFSQSGDATWLDTMDGLQTAIGRSWTVPPTFIEEFTVAELNEQGTPISEISARSEPASTPMGSDEMRTQNLSALIYQYDSVESAEEGVELFHAAQLDQISRDPRNPATTEFAPELDAQSAYGNEGIFEAPNFDGGSNEMAVVYVLAQDGDLIYQVFGVFLPGNHIELATEVANAMIDAEVGAGEPVHDMSGESTGGLWEKLNAIQIAMPDESYITDLQIYPPGDDAVMGESVVVPVIDLDDLASVEGMLDSWHITYAPAETGVLISTPNVLPDGVFNIELWAMEFEDSTHATAAAIALNATLTDPLGIVSTEGGSFATDERQGMTMVSSGFVQDRSLPEGDAAVVVVVEESHVYAARVYSNGPAPTPLANGLVTGMMDAEANGAEMWDVFPQSGDELLHGLEPIIVRHENPTQPVSTPVG